MVSSLTNRKIINQNIIMGEKVLKNFHSEYPYYLSNTKINLKIKQHSKDRKFAPLLGKLCGKSYLTGFKLEGIREGFEKGSEELSYLKKAIHNKKVANCGECSAIVADELEKNNIPYKNIIMDVYSNAVPNKRMFNHKFTIIGFDSKADIANPKTWGKNAVIIDAWANIVKRAQDGLEHIKQLFNINPNKDTCIFKNSAKYI